MNPDSTARDESHREAMVGMARRERESHPSDLLTAIPIRIRKKLKQAIARLKGVAENRIFIGGAGSDEAIDLVYRISAAPGVD